jgi:hypothetical protein
MRKLTLFIMVTVVVAAFVLACCCGDLDTESDEPTIPDTGVPFGGEDTKEVLPGIGDPVESGSWGFCVTGVSHPSSVSDYFSSYRPNEGWKFVVVDVEVGNLTKKTETFTEGSDFPLVSSDGLEYTPYSEAWSAVNDGEWFCVREVPPQTKVLVRIPYQVPEGKSGFKIGVKGGLFESQKYVDIGE